MSTLAFISLFAQFVPTVPTWSLILSGLLTGGVVAAVFTYLGKRTDAKAAAPGAEASANLTGVEALTNVISTLSAEAARSAVRLTDFSSAFDRVEAKLDLARDLISAQLTLLEARPTKEDLIGQVGRLVEQLVSLGVLPTNGPSRLRVGPVSAPLPDLSPELPPPDPSSD